MDELQAELYAELNDFDDDEDELEAFADLDVDVDLPGDELPNAFRAVDTLDDVRGCGATLWLEMSESSWLPNQVKDVISQSILLPNWERQWRFALSYLMLPSRYCTNLPVLMSWGNPGSGKSALAYLLSAMHGIPVLTSDATTFAALRNQILNSRFSDPNGAWSDANNELNTFLLFEDCSGQTFKSETGQRIYVILKTGTNHKAKAAIAEVGGTNKEFPIFSPKVLSTVDPFWAMPEFAEIRRRLLVVHHKPFQQWQGDDFNGWNGLAGYDLTEFDDIDWSGFKSRFTQFWEDHRGEWKRVKSSIAKRKTTMPTPFFKLVQDVMICGVVCGFYSDVSEAVSDFERYWEWHVDNVVNCISPTAQLLKNYITDVVSKTGIEEIEPDSIKSFLNAKAKAGELDVIPTPKEVRNAMMQIGYHLIARGKYSTWVKM